ncbi:MAG: hypothetical protein A2798_00250 [Candidatus Levybacteria bacterium RIFCSPHIGHO2_01_FULL_37_17]|nr:MAG: hypothetical protein A2798_00250 [Candidatus Levybacteria bacterium RIFCSPHIGHO2_01_FULL_37_17]OGH36476.1 MAG: hypothetical protein A2959_03115 [Candidatus Levybacteria bacterium RIFCSPLOWO2_01_FULL_38_23]
MIERRAYKPNFGEERRLVYNPSFDERDYKSYHLLPPSEREKLKSYTRRQLEAYVGERVEVIKSTTRFEIVEDTMVAKGLDQSMEEMIRTGVEYRKEYGNPLDFEREEAELSGAILIQKELTKKEAKPGAKRISVSSKGEEGSDYTNNFFDVYELKVGEDGRRFIELNRYLSTLTLEEYKEKLKPFSDCEGHKTASDFLKNPIEADVFETSDDVQKYLNKGVNALEKEKLEIINRIIAPVISSYINSLVENPYDFFTHRVKYNAVLNESDNALAVVLSGDTKELQNLIKWASFSSREDVEKRAMIIGLITPRIANGPCPGISGGFNMMGGVETIGAPYSVGQFGQKKDIEQTKLCCTCPFCNKQVEAEIGGGTISCPNCKKSAPYSKLN